MTSEEIKTKTSLRPLGVIEWGPSVLISCSSHLKLHIGCGDHYIKGFLHIDIRRLPHVDIVTPAEKLLFFVDGSVDLIYACHILEHYGRHDIQKPLKEWYRVLKIGGILRLSVPDFASITYHYYRTGKIEDVMGLLYGGQNYTGNTHYVTFDMRYMDTQLKLAGFSDVTRYDWKTTEHSDVDDYSQAYLPHMDKENGLLMSLNVECKKLK